VPSKYEGDGMVVAEAIIRNYSVLLADNSDLRRFNLPDNNYFKDQPELANKLATWKKSKGEAFTIPNDFMKGLIRERDLGEISNRWKAFLNKLATERKK
jgi:glycosyltransferase involved in cell wall biosynthesis